MGLFGEKNKVNKIKSALPQRIGRIFLWVVVAFLLLRGIGSFLKPNSTNTASDIVNSYKENKDYTDRIEFEASAFARMFAIDYMTYKGDNTDYDNRLKKYSNLDFIGAYNNKLEALSSESYRIELRGKDNVNVDVKLRVRYTVKQQQDNLVGEAPKPDTVTVNDVYLRIPIYAANGKYLVEDYPVFIPEPSKGAKPEITKQGKDVSSDTKEKIQSAVENFLKTYCSGNSVEMSYYLADTNKTENGLDKRYNFKKLILEEFDARELEAGKYFVTTQFEVEDSINSQIFKQSIQIRIIVKDNKYLIDSFNGKLN